MSCDYLALANQGVQGLQAYQPGKPISELERELGLSDIVKLASNENPLGLSPKVAKLLSENLDDLSRYPDGAAFELKAALANYYGIDVKQITLGNGSNDILNLIGLAFIDQQSSVVFSEHAFIVYPILTQYLGARANVAKAENYGHDLEAMLQAIDADTKVVFIANPNNPTGTWLGTEALTAFLQQVPEHVLVVLDEAYNEYIDPSVDCANGLELQKQFANVIVTRTFSKAFGLAGLRVGFSVANEQITDVLNRVREPFNVNSLGQLAAIEVLKDSHYLQRSIEVNQQGRIEIQQGLERLGYTFIPSQGNFITFDCQQNGQDLYQKLLHEGVIVRPVAGYGLPNHLRVSIGMPFENLRFLNALERIHAR